MSASRRLYFPKVVFRLGVVALLALLVQLIAIYAPLGSDDLPRRVLMLGSYLMLFVFVGANIKSPGIAIIGVGLFLNFLPIVANGGLMPVTPETLLRTGPLPQGVETGEWVPNSKDVLLEREDTRFYFLSDRLVWQDLPGIRAFSIGDVVLFGGLIVVLGELLLPRVRRRDANDTPAPK